MKIKTLSLTTALAAACLVSTATAHADTLLGVYADAAYWSQSGDIGFSQNSGSDASFDFDAESAPMVSLALEHGVPVIPNVKVRYSTLKGSDSKNIGTFTFANQSYTGTADVDINLTQTDLLAYYEILDNVVSVDVGLGAKLLNGDIKVTSTLTSDKEDVNLAIPMVYGAAAANLPFSGLSASADIAGFQYQDNRIIDASARVQYNFIDSPVLDLGCFAGYRVVDVQIDDIEKTSASGTFKGPFLGVAAHF